MVVNTAKPHSLGCVQRTSHWKEKKFRYASRTSSPCHVSTKHNQKAGHRYLHRLDKTLESEIPSSEPQGSIHSAWISRHRSHLFTTKYNLSNKTDGSRRYTVVKTKYHTKVISHYINATDSNKELQNITMMDALCLSNHGLQYLSTIPDITIVNCFSKPGISRESQ